jgi:hypothetical protein
MTPNSLTPNFLTSALFSSITTGGNRPGANAAGARATYFARFVRAGPVIMTDREESDITVTPEALLSAYKKGLFENKAVFIDHTGWFDNPSLEKLAGKTQHVTYDLATESIMGEIIFNETPSGRLAMQIIDDLLADDHPADIGLSISFYPVLGVGANGVRPITDIRHVESVDLVFQPAADGRILAALSAHSVGAIGNYHARSHCTSHRTEQRRESYSRRPPD